MRLGAQHPSCQSVWHLDLRRIGAQQHDVAVNQVGVEFPCNFCVAVAYLSCGLATIRAPWLAVRPLKICPILSLNTSVSLRFQSGIARAHLYVLGMQAGGRNKEGNSHELDAVTVNGHVYSIP